MPRSIDLIDERMRNVEGDEFRYHVLETAKKFKTSWIELGRSLYAVWKDKKFKEWGYQTFDAYTSREIGIRKQTSMKLLKSYYFLEKEEPHYLREEYLQSEEAQTAPSYEAVDVLRMAKQKKLDQDDYVSLKEKLFLKGKDAKEVRRDLSTLIRQREELDPDEAIAKKKTAQIKRLMGTLKSLKREIEAGKIVPQSVLKDVQLLITKLSEYVD